MRIIRGGSDVGKDDSGLVEELDLDLPQKLRDNARAMDGRDSPSKARSWASMAWVALGLGVIALLHTVFWYGTGRADFYAHFGEADRLLGVGEMRLYLFMLLLGLPGGACIARGLRDPLAQLGARMMGARPILGGLWLPALFAAVGTFIIAHFVTGYAWFTDDEQAYLLQADLYAHGRLSMPRVEPAALFSHRFVVEVLSKNDVTQVTGAYPPLQPLLMAVSGWLGHPHLSQFICVGLITYHTGRLASTLFGDEVYGRIAAWLCATSPLLLGLGATLHTSILGTMLSVIALRLWLATRDGGGLGTGLALGLAVGTLAVARPLEGALGLAVSGLGLLLLFVFPAWGEARRPSLGKGLVGMSLGVLVPLSVLAIVNVELTGHPMRGAYYFLEKKIGGFMGFGHHMMWGRTHSVELGLVQTVTALVRVNAFALGWPISLGLAVLSVCSPFRRRATLLLLGLMGLHVSAYFFLAFGSVHDFGHAYHVWHLPMIASLSAWVLVQGYRRGQASARSLHAQLLPLVAAMSIAALTVFWPAQLQRWHDIAETIWRPVRAVEAKLEEGRPTIVLWTRIQPPGAQTTWVLQPPAPRLDRTVLWAKDTPMFYSELKRSYPDYAFLRLLWLGDRPVVLPLTQ